MDADLKLLADASLHVSAAEESVAEGAHHTARDSLDAARLALDELRGRWAAMSDAARTVVGPAAAQVRSRIDSADGRIPRLSALSETAPVVDPEQELEPTG
jgi:hypothetical protein